MHSGKRIAFKVNGDNSINKYSSIQAQSNFTPTTTNYKLFYNSEAVIKRQYTTCWANKNWSILVWKIAVVAYGRTTGKTWQTKVFLEKK